MIDGLRSLFRAHLALARAELAAIVREALGLAGALALALAIGLFGLLAAIVLLVIALSALLLGSPLFGAFLLVTGSALAVALLLTGALRAPGRRRALALAALSGGSLALVLVTGIRQPAGTAIGWALLLASVNATMLLLARLREVDTDALAARFYPRVSIAEIERTIESADELIGGRR